MDRLGDYKGARAVCVQKNCRTPPQSRVPYRFNAASRYSSFTASDYPDKSYVSFLAFIIHAFTYCCSSNPAPGERSVLFIFFRCFFLSLSVILFSRLAAASVFYERCLCPLKRTDSGRKQDLDPLFFFFWMNKHPHVRRQRRFASPRHLRPTTTLAHNTLWTITNRSLW